MDEFAKWQDKYEAKVEFIDQQHRHLLEIMNKLHADLKDGKGDVEEAFRCAAKEAVNYVKEHFSAEEKWMLETDCPDYERQKAEHLKFIKRLLDDTVKFKAGDHGSALHFLHFLRDWLLGHIAIEAKNFRAHVAKLQKNSETQGGN